MASFGMYAVMKVSLYQNAESCVIFEPCSDHFTRKNFNELPQFGVLYIGFPTSHEMFRGHVHIHVATHNVERGSHILQNFHKIVILPRDYGDNVERIEINPPTHPLITSIRRYAWQYEYGREPLFKFLCHGQLLFICV